jgi:anti-sigma regulatory factor (Ser/Thr protein kinase)
MSVIGIINSDPAVKKLIETAFHIMAGPAFPAKAAKNSKALPDYTLRHLSSEKEILEFLSYDLPEMVILNFSDPSIEIDTVVARIRDDKWVMNFGIIGIYSGEKTREEKLLKKYKMVNVLTILDYNHVHSHIVKSIQILEQNYQIIFAREFTRNLMDGASGSFLIDNDILAAPLYAGMGATILAQRGLINPDNKMHLQLALEELIINAVEHGNCGITYKDKTEGMEMGLSVVDLVMEKCKDPMIRGKKVEFQWEIQNDKSIFIIKDEGKGFDVKAHFKKIAEQDVLSLHGRGIRLASMFSHEVKYNARGNQVSLIIKHDPAIEHEIPLGFSKEQVIKVAKGDIVLKEGEPSDFLYYISSGQYSVFHNRKQVGSLSPQDIFMGEMSFLLNQKRSATIRADSDGKLIFLSRKAFVSVIREFPHYGIFLSRLLAKRLVRSNDRNAALISRIQAKEGS